MESQQVQLQRDVQRLVDLCAHLQDRSEQQRAAIADQLHDEIGGILVAARLNVGWLEERLPSEDPGIQLHFKRLQDALRQGVEVMRRIVEDLRPTLLDNIGLYSALRWYMAEACEGAQLGYTERYPEDELQFKPAASIGVFRIVEEALVHLIARARPKRVHLEVEETPSALHVRLGTELNSAGSSTESVQPLDVNGPENEAIRQRVLKLGGVSQLREPAAGQWQLEVSLPLSNLLVTGAEPR
jgi:signal transduction histidine kinase